MRWMVAHLEGGSRSDELLGLVRERDFYRTLLDLGREEEIEPFLKQALELIVAIAGAGRGYIELRDDRSTGEGPVFWIASGCSEEEVAAIRAALSQGVIAEALASHETIVTASALADPRFRDRGSVRKNRIEAVLCAPIGTGVPLGVLYLQERLQGGAFTEADRVRAEGFARHAAVFADRLLMRRRRREETDRTAPYRKRLRGDGILGRSDAIARVLQQVSLIAPRDVTVLLTGPSGTGKTRVARLIHQNSPRAERVFMDLNCAALPESLIEGELFGALPGAHSTANHRIEGKVAAAQRGTLFLDEIGELSLATQAKLLQLLQSKEYFPLGSSKPVKADVRIIAATNVDLKAAVAARTFREDLFYRLHVLPIRMPSLAERRTDIAELATYFCERACDTHQLPSLRLSPGATLALETSEWPGNIRELEHSIEAAALRAASEDVPHIQISHLFPEERVNAPETSLTFQESTRRFQERLLRTALEETDWNITAAATRLDLTRAHVYNLIRSFGLPRSRQRRA